MTEYDRYQLVLNVYSSNYCWIYGGCICIYSGVGEHEPERVTWRAPLCSNKDGKIWVHTQMDGELGCVEVAHQETSDPVLQQGCHHKYGFLKQKIASEQQKC